MSQRVQQVNARNRNINQSKEIGGIVEDVVLDTRSEFVKEFPDVEIETKDTTIIGFAIVKRGDDFGGGSGETLTAYPPYDLSQGLPLRGESVYLVPVGGVLHYKRSFSNDVSVGNAQLDKLNSVQPNKREQSSASSYNEVSSTKTSRASNQKTKSSKFGEYYQPQQINPLKLYEGDSLIQSRFGQTIRLSGYNNEENTFSPTIIIRNRQNGEVETKEKRGTLIEEDINKDGSSIILSSRDYKIDLKPGTIDDGGSQQLDTKPKAFNTYPSELTGTDQILINSGRVILSSKKDEMIFISKGNYGFVSDGKFSIDNGKAGADFNFNGDVRIATNSKNIFISAGSINFSTGTFDEDNEIGKIFLNTDEETQPLIRGAKLVEFLTELIDYITKQIYLTPSGPTGTGPSNTGDFIALKTKLGELKSTKNYTE